MPKRSSEYVNENGDDFVEDAPQNKKRRGGAKAHTEMHEDDDGNEFWEVSEESSSFIKFCKLIVVYRSQANDVSRSPRSKEVPS